MNTRSFVEEICGCGRVWRGRPGCHMSCDECYPWTDEDEAALEEYEERKRERIARENEY